MRSAILAHMDRRDRRWVAVVTAAFIVMGLLHVVLVAPGLPYDEPSHFNVVQHFARLDGLPVPHQSGAGYEAYHAPLYYFLFGLIYRLALGGGIKFAFYLLRVLTLLAAAPLVYLTYKAAREFSGRRGIARLASVFIGLNPATIAIASSIQNDTQLYVLSALSAYLAIRWTLQLELTPRRALLLGLIVSMTMLTKIQGIVLTPFVLGIVLLTHRRRSMARVAIFLAAVACCTAWWYARNVRLYHDWTGADSVSDLFGSGGKFLPWKFSSWLLAGRSLVSELTVPITYWRDLVKCPVWIRLGVEVSSGLVALGMAAALYRRRTPARNAAGWWVLFGLAGIAVWMAVIMREYFVGARVALAGCSAVSFIVALGVQQIRLQVARVDRRLARHWPLILAIVFIATGANLLHRESRLVNLPDFIHLADDRPESAP